MTSSAFCQFKIGVYRQSYKDRFIEITFAPKHKFTFYDTRNESCFSWGKIEGQWELSNDTLTLIYPSGYLIYDEIDVNKKFTQVNTIEKKIYLISGNEINFIRAEGFYSKYDWGNFKYNRRK